MGQKSVCEAEKVDPQNKDEKPRLFCSKQLHRFHVELKAQPIFHGRFDNVPIDRIGLMVKKIYEILLFTAKRGIVMKFEKIFILHVLMNITEAEMNIFFDIFLKTFRFQGDEFFGKYEDILDEIKSTMLSVRRRGTKYLQFYTEVKRNPMLNPRFLYVSPFVFSRMIDEIIYIADTPLPEREFGVFAEQHRKLNITGREFDEFLRLFFQHCSSDINYFRAVGPKIEKIRETIVDEPFDQVLSFSRSLQYPAKGPLLLIPLTKLRVMHAQIVDFVLNPELLSTEEIIETHKSVNISKRGYREFVRSFVNCCPNAEFKRKAKLMFTKLEKKMVTPATKRETFIPKIEEDS